MCACCEPLRDWLHDEPDPDAVYDRLTDQSLDDERSINSAEDQ